MLRQSFTVLGEAIILSLVTVAKTQPIAATSAAANKTLQIAFNACLAAATFGAAFFIVFGHVVLQAVLQPEFIAPTQDLIPIFAVAFAFTTMRNFYFAQVIYFTNASYLELVVALLFLAFPRLCRCCWFRPMARTGAAIALMVACIFACLAFMALGRRWYRMPIDLDRARRHAGAGDPHLFSARTDAGQFLPGHSLPLVVDAAIFAVFGGFAIHHFGLLSLPSAEVVGDRVTAL